METLQVDQLIKEAMKAGNHATLQLLRSVKAKVLLVKTSAGRKPEQPLSEQEMHDCLRKEIKELQEHLAGVKQKLSSAETLSEAERKEYQGQQTQDEQSITYLTRFLPQTLTMEEVQRVIGELLQEGKKLPDIMKHFSQNFKGRVDMKQVSEWVKAKLS